MRQTDKECRSRHEERVIVSIKYFIQPCIMLASLLIYFCMNLLFPSLCAVVAWQALCGTQQWPKEYRCAVYG